MKHGRTPLVVLLVAGLTLPAVATAARADTTTVSGLVIDSVGADGFNNAPSVSYLAPSSPITVIVSGTKTTFHTTTASGAPVNIGVTPPTSVSQLTAGSFPLAKTATSTEGALSAGFFCGSTASGTFDIHAAAYSGSTLTSFSATWSYGCSGYPDVAYGEIRYQAPDGIASSVAPRTVALAPNAVGMPSAPVTVTITNNGTLPVTYGDASFTGANAGEFSTQDNQCSGQLVQPTATCSVAVVATPSAGGPRTARLQVLNGGARGFAASNVTANGLNAPDAPLSVVAERAATGVALSWSGAPVTNHNPASSFEVLRGPDADSLALLATPSSIRYGDALSDTTAAGTTYVYAVRAVNAGGTSPLSATSSATTPSAAFTASSTRAISWDGSQDGMHPGSVTVSDPVVNLGGSTTSAAASAYLGLTNVTASVVPPVGARLASGASFDVAPTADATHGTLDASVMSIGTRASHGTVTINRIEQALDGTLLALDLDASFAYSATAGTDHVQVRVGTDNPYTAVDLPSIDAGQIAVDDVKDTVATYTNTGTAPLVVGSVTLTQPSTDWSVADGGTCAGATLAPTASCTVPLHVAPAARGTRSAVLVITDSTAVGVHRAALAVAAVGTPLAPSSLVPSRTGGKVALSWSDPSGYDSHATSYTVYRGPDSAHLAVLGTTTTSTFTDPDTADGTRTYAVSAANVAGTSPTSEVVVNASLGAPALVSGATVKTVELAWAPADSLPANPVTGYRVYRGTTATALTTIQDVTGTTLSTTAPAAGVKAYFAVAALSGSVVGPRSAVSTVTGQSSQLVTASVKYSSSPLQVHALDGSASHDLPDAFANNPVRVEVAVSPNGLKVAYVELTAYGTTLRSSVYVRNVDGTGTTTHLYDAEGTNLIGGLSWSPNGTTLALSVLNASSSHLLTLTLAGASQVVANSADLSSPSWLNGTTLVAEDDATYAAPLVTIAASATGPGTRTPLDGTTAGGYPSVNAQGTEIAFMVPTGQDEYDSLHVLTLATHATRTLSAPADAYLSTPSWSRNGKTLYFTATTKARTYGLLYSLAATTGSTATVLGDGSHGNQFSVAVSTPDVTGPTVALSAPAVTTATSVKPAITATDLLNDVVSYSVSYRRIGYAGGWSATTTVTAATPPTIALGRGFEYCFTARATDRVGNVSVATKEVCTVSPLDDRSLARSAGFKAVTNRAYYAGTAATSTTRGQTLTRTGVTGARQLYVVASTCATCGTADVLVGSVRVGSINLHGATGDQRVLTLPAPAPRSGTVTLKVTSTGKPVTLDGLGVRR